MLTAAIVEIYYAIGSGMSWQGKLGDKVVMFADTTISWIATAVSKFYAVIKYNKGYSKNLFQVFLFLAMIFYFGDAIVTALTRRQTYTPKQPPR